MTQQAILIVRFPQTCQGHRDIPEVWEGHDEVTGLASYWGSPEGTLGHFQF